MANKPGDRNAEPTIQDIQDILTVIFSLLGSELAFARAKGDDAVLRLWQSCYTILLGAVATPTAGAMQHTYDTLERFASTFARLSHISIADQILATNDAMEKFNRIIATVVTDMGEEMKDA